MSIYHIFSTKLKRSVKTVAKKLIRITNEKFSKKHVFLPGKTTVKNSTACQKLYSETHTNLTKRPVYNESSLAKYGYSI
jgi:hypothetical protein